MTNKPVKPKKGRIALRIVLGLLLALILGVFAVVKLYLNQIERIEKEPEEIIAPVDEFFEEDVEMPADESEEAPSEEAESTPEPVADIDPADVEWDFIEEIEDDDLINILLIGQDKYPGVQSKNRQRSDTMILCSINPQTGEVSMISFLRDLYVEIPGDYSDNRLNAPFVFGGLSLLNETLYTNFGVTVDANFVVDMNGFKAIINLLGGVDVELTDEEVRYMQVNWSSAIHEGVNRLNADHALIYSQLRSIGTDFGRTERQRKVLMSIFREVRQLPVDELMELTYEMLSYVSTDLTDAELLSLAYRLVPMLSSVSVETHSVPSNGTYHYATIRKMSVLVPDREKIRQQLQDEYLPLH